MDRTELDLYEQTARFQVGLSRAREMRRELEAHLSADVATRLEDGVSESEAWAQALSALGDLRRAAKAERPPFLGLGRFLLFVAPCLPLIAFAVQPGLVQSPRYPATGVYAALWIGGGAFIIAGAALSRRLGAAALFLGVAAGTVFITCFEAVLPYGGSRSWILSAIGNALGILAYVTIFYLLVLLTLEALERGFDRRSGRKARG